MVVQIIMPDRPGILAESCSMFATAGWNIVDLQQHSEDGFFYARYEVDVGKGAEGVMIKQTLQQLLPSATITICDPEPAVSILLSKQRHCLDELQRRYTYHDLPGSIVGVYSNALHDDVERLPNENTEEAIIRSVDNDKPSLLVLARYMKILSPWMLEELRIRNIACINIHHSFLPAFPGANPYQRAWQRGVKALGATAHYVTEELDAGPIIAQAVQSVDHQPNADDLQRIGRDLEQQALYEAVRAHLQGKVLQQQTVNSRCIVFS